MSQALLTFDPIGASETVVRSIDFAPGLADGETLTADSATCEIDVITGTDANLADRLHAGPTIAGTIVSVRIGGLIDGNTYRVRLDVGTSGDQLLSCWSQQKCVGP